MASAGMLTEGELSQNDVLHPLHIAGQLTGQIVTPCALFPGGQCLIFELSIRRASIAPNNWYTTLLKP
jgi:hypothetical protein